MLDPEAFDKAMNRLKVLPTQGGFETGEEFASRKLVYLDALQDLDTERVMVACGALLRESGRVYFPTPGEIRAEAEAWKPVSAGLLPRSPERIEADREAGRENVRRGLEIIQQKAAESGLDLKLRPREWPSEKRIKPLTIEDTDERRAELRRQADEIQR